MPGLDGYEVVAELKANPGTSNVPILVLTGQQLTQADKSRLNGKIVGICEKGDQAPARLRAWLSEVADGHSPVPA